MNYAFIDFQNTDNTTKQLLGFAIDWKKLCDFLKNNFYIFTGDGDFEFLIKNVILKGVKTYIVSSAKKIKSGGRYFTSRLSKKLRRLCGENPGKVNFIEINDLKLRIQK